MDNKLQAMDNYYREILNKQTGMILSIVKEGLVYKCILCRGGLMKRLGYADDVGGQPLTKFMSEKEVNFIIPFVGRAWNGEALDFRFATDDDTCHYFVQLKPVQKRGEITEVIASYSDITAFSSQLKELESFEKEKTAFWRNVNSELRTPMNSIMGITDLLSDTALDNQQSEYFDIVQDSVGHLNKVFDDVLFFSNIEADKFQFEYAPFDLYDTATSVVEGMHIKGDSRNIALSLAYEDSLARRVVGDQSRVAQIMRNLLEGVLEAMPENGGLKLVVREGKMEFDGAVKIIMDIVPSCATGKSIDTITLDDLSTIQFSIASQLIKIMRGGLQEEKKETGNIISCVVELMRDAKTDPNAKKILKGVAVLCLMGKGSERQPFIAAMKSDGAQMIFQYNAHDAVSDLEYAFKRKKPYKYLLIADVQVEVSSLELVKNIKSSETIKGTNIVIILAPENQAQEKIFIDAGADTVLVSPLAKDSLKNTLMDLSGRHGKMKAMAIGQEPEVKSKTMGIAQAPEAEVKPKAIDLKMWASVLVVEDNRVNRMMAQSVLKKFGCKVDGAGDGLEALEAVKRNDYDLILMDCQMPRVDGYEASKRIKAMLAAGEIPALSIVALTAQTDQASRDRCLKSGMDNYLSKPVSLDRLKEVLRLYLGHKMSS